jgi:5-methylthioadenosine/S-adenosylhomocysteine deaminase
MGAEEILEMAMLHGARAAGLDHLIGSLETGKRADIVIRSTGSAELWPGIDPAHQLIAAGHGPTVDAAIVNGRIVMRHGRAVLLDEAAVFAEARASALRVAKRLGMQPSSAWPLA